MRIILKSDELQWGGSLGDMARIIQVFRTDNIPDAAKLIIDEDTFKIHAIWFIDSKGLPKP